MDFFFGTGEFEGRNITRKPKMILLDFKMPKVDGFEVLKRIKTNELTMMIPVAILTSSKELTDLEMAYSLDANSYIVKPVDFDGFCKVIAEMGFYWIVINQPPF